MLVTVEELKQLQALSKMIEYQQERLENIRAAAYFKSPHLTGMPKGSGYHDRISETIPAAIDLESKITKELEELQEKKQRLETWIEQQPVRIQLIARLRFLEGLSWDEVADEVYRDLPNPKTTDALRMSFLNHLKAANKREIEKQKERGSNTMSIFEQLKDELQNMTQEQRQSLADLIAGKKNEPKAIVYEPMKPNRTGPNGEPLTEEQHYDFTHPIEFWAPDYTETVQYMGKKTIIHKTKQEIAAHNDRLLQEWIQRKMEYAAKHGLSFSPEYNPPKKVKRR